MPSPGRCCCGPRLTAGLRGGQTEIDLWIGLGTALGLTAAANVVPQVTVAAEPPSKVTVEPLNPIVSSEGVTYPQSSDTKADAADYDARHDKN
jgi:hypothetical protein